MYIYLDTHVKPTCQKRLKLARFWLSLPNYIEKAIFFKETITITNKKQVCGQKVYHAGTLFRIVITSWTGRSWHSVQVFISDTSLLCQLMAQLQKNLTHFTLSERRCDMRLHQKKKKSNITSYLCRMHIHTHKQVLLTLIPDTLLRFPIHPARGSHY